MFLHFLRFSVSIFLPFICGTSQTFVFFVYYLVCKGPSSFSLYQVRIADSGIRMTNFWMTCLRCRGCLRSMPYSESSKPVQLRTYLHKTLRHTKTSMYKFAPPPTPSSEGLKKSKTCTKFAPPCGRHPSRFSVTSRFSLQNAGFCYFLYFLFHNVAIRRPTESPNGFLVSIYILGGDTLARNNKRDLRGHPL